MPTYGKVTSAELFVRPERTWVRPGRMVMRWLVERTMNLEVPRHHIAFLAVLG